MSIKDSYYQKAIVFGSLDKGGHMQIYELFDKKKRKLGITKMAVQKTSKDSWEVAYCVDGKDYATFQAALRARRKSK